MSYKNIHPSKKIKVDVSKDHDNLLKVENVPVVFTDYGSSCNNTYNHLVYLQAPDWQNNPYESEQLHEQVHLCVKSNVSYFEILPNELVQDLFQYLPLMDLFRSFYYLNQRYRQLIQYQLTQQAHIRLDLTNLSVREFDFICSQFNPKHVEALTIGDCDTNRIDETCSFGQIALFLYRYHLSQFSSLTSLRIINPYDNNQHILLLNQLREKQLKHLCIRFRSRSPKNLDFCFRFADTIESISLDQVTLTDLTQLSRINFKYLQYICINDISLACLLSLLSEMPRLRYLQIRLMPDSGVRDMHYTKSIKCEPFNVTTLYLESVDTSWMIIELHLLNLMPNLRRLSLIGDYKTPMIQLVEQWKQSFLKYTHHLIDFRFHVNIPSENWSSNIDKLLKPFREGFWQERKWHAAVDVKHGKNLHLYSLLSPQCYQSLEITSRMHHRLTTLRESSDMTYMSYHSIKFLNTSSINKDIQTTLNHNLYSKVHSLIIGHSVNEITLQRQIHLSSIYELTFTHNTNSIYFINLLNTMTHLKSLRLVKESSKILLLLKENSSLIKCLQNRAIRKLFLQNSYDAEDLTKKGVFPINEFIQVFANSLEYLHWTQPPITVLISFLINDLPKLKSLTTTWHQNTVISTHELTQWIQENTRLNTFVTKWENINDITVWHLWL